MEQTATAKGAGLAGAVKGTYKAADIGEFEVTGNTSEDFSASLKFTNLGNGIGAKTKVSLGKKNDKKVLKINQTVDYSQDYFSASGDFTLKEEIQGTEGKFSGVVKVGAVIGSDGVWLGGLGTTNVASDGKFSTPDLDLHFELREKDFTVGLSCESAEDGSAKLLGKFYQDVSSDLQRGLVFDWHSRSLTFASKYALADDTTVKTSISTEGIIQTALTHTLSNPKAKVNVATEFHTTNGFDLSVKRHGIGVTLGDF